MADPMTPEELAAIDARLEAATPGPWIRSPLPGTPIQSVDTADDVIAFVQTGKSHEVVSNQAVADADFIAHAPEDLRRLRAEVERLAGEVKGLTFCAETYKERAEKAEAEVERLTALVERGIKTGEDWRGEAERQRAEVERLAGFVAQAGVLLAPAGALLAESQKEIERIKKEVERLIGLVTTATVEAAKAQKENARLRALFAEPTEEVFDRLCAAMNAALDKRPASVTRAAAVIGAILADLRARAEVT